MNIRWKLRMAAAQREVWTGTQLRRLLAEKAGLELSAASVSALFTKEPAQVKLSTLAALCTALECTPNDLFEVDTTPVARPPRRRGRWRTCRRPPRPGAGRCHPCDQRRADGEEAAGLRQAAARRSASSAATLLPVLAEDHRGARPRRRARAAGSSGSSRAIPGDACCARGRAPSAGTRSAARSHLVPDCRRKARRRGPAALPAMRPPGYLRVTPAGAASAPGSATEGPAPGVRQCGQVRRHEGLGLCSACWQRRPEAALRPGRSPRRPARRPAGLAGRLRRAPGRRVSRPPGPARDHRLGRLLGDEHPDHPQALLERARRPGRSMGSLARALEDYFTAEGLALPTDQAERLAAGRRQRRIDAVPLRCARLWPGSASHARPPGSAPAEPAPDPAPITPSRPPWPSSATSPCS